MTMREVRGNSDNLGIFSFIFCPNFLCQGHHVFYIFNFTSVLLFHIHEHFSGELNLPNLSQSQLVRTRITERRFHSLVRSSHFKLYDDVASIFSNLFTYNEFLINIIFCYKISRGKQKSNTHEPCVYNKKLNEILTCQMCERSISAFAPTNREPRHKWRAI